MKHLFLFVFAFFVGGYAAHAQVDRNVYALVDVIHKQTTTGAYPAYLSFGLGNVFYNHLFTDASFEVNLVADETRPAIGNLKGGYYFGNKLKIAPVVGGSLLLISNGRNKLDGSLLYGLRARYKLVMLEGGARDKTPFVSCGVFYTL